MLKPIATFHLVERKDMSYPCWTEEGLDRCIQCARSLGHRFYIERHNVDPAVAFLWAQLPPNSFAKNDPHATDGWAWVRCVNVHFLNFLIRACRAGHFHSPFFVEWL